MNIAEETINQSPQMPLNTRPIIVIGAGGIVTDAHLPAYKLANFPVYGIFDVDVEKAKQVALKFGIPKVFDSLESLLSEVPSEVIFDIALPAAALVDVLKKLPNGSFALLQKPMGDDLAEAEEILNICSSKNIKAAVNLQLRYAPFMLAAKDLIAKDIIGNLCDVEFNINVFTPWHLWQFMYTIPRVEISYHSIHYIDFVRSVLGNPQDVYAKTTKHPNSPGLASVRSDIVMDYGDSIRANIHTNHNHDFGIQNQHSYVKFEGTKGAIKIQMGLLINYPKGIADKFEYISKTDGKEAAWQEVKINGSWFPHAFIGSMAQLMCFAEGSSIELDNAVEDVIWTMRCVEAAYETKVPSRFLAP